MTSIVGSSPARFKTKWVQIPNRSNPSSYIKNFLFILQSGEVSISLGS